jgi:DNA polymerase III subunit epsilon
VRSAELLDFYRQLYYRPLTVVDVETTGSQPITCRVIEVSVLQASIEEGIYFQQTHLINPLVPVPVSITHFTGISQSMVNTAPLAAEVWPLYRDALNAGVLTAHNLAFDYGFLQAEYTRLGIAYARPTGHQLCTVLLSRLLLPELPSRRLPDLVKHFGFAVGASHRAEADTLACWLLTKHLLIQIQNTPDADLIARFARQWIGIPEAARILQCQPEEAEYILLRSGVRGKRAKRGSSPSYLRGAVEQVGG